MSFWRFGVDIVDSWNELAHPIPVGVASVDGYGFH